MADILPVAPAPPPVGPPGIPLPDVDPLTGLPLGPPAPQSPYGYQLDAQGLPWPPSHWAEGDQPAVDQAAAPPPAPAELAPPPVVAQEAPQGYVGHDVPVVEDKLPPPPVEHARDPLAEAGAMAASEATPQPARDPYLDYLDKSADAHAQALVDKTHAEQAKNSYLAEQGVELARDASRKQAAADSMFMQAQQEAKQKRVELDQEAQAIANQKIDPRRAWHNMSFGAQLFTGLTAALVGATTRSVQTGQNSVVDMVNKMAAQDMEAQQLDIQNRTTSLGMRRGLLADDLAAGRDVLDFQYKSINAAYDMAANGIKAYALKYDNLALNAIAAEQLAQLSDAKVASGMKYEEAKKEQVYKREQDRIHNAQTWADIKVRQDHQKMLADKEAREAAAGPSTSPAMMNAVREAEKDRRERLLPQAKTKDGKQLYAKDSGAATKINAKVQGATSGVSKIDELMAIHEKHGWMPMGSWSTDHESAMDAERANTLTQGLMTDFSLEKGQGTIRDGEYDRYEKMIGKVGGLRDPRGSLMAMRETFINDVNDSLQAEASLDEQGNVVESGYWVPKPHYKAPFDEGGQAKKQPGIVGIPAQGQTGSEAPLSPEQEQFMKTGKFVPAPKKTEEQGLIDFAGGG